MSESDKRPVEVGDLRLALALLARVPVPGGALNTARSAQAVWAYPVAGALIGAVAGGLGALALALGLPAGLAAGMALAGLCVLTGALHEDGLADTADGFWGGWDRARRLEIMRDSRIGTYGVLALAFSVLLRWAALSALAGAGLLWPAMIAAAALSRAAMPPLMATLPHARDDGLSRQVGRPGRRAATTSVGLGALIALICLGPTGLAALALGALVAAGCGAIALRKIGGQTGDVLGATQQLAEITVLLAATALLL